MLSTFIVCLNFFIIKCYEKNQKINTDTILLIFSADLIQIKFANVPVMSFKQKKIPDQALYLI